MKKGNKEKESDCFGICEGCAGRAQEDKGCTTRKRLVKAAQGDEKVRIN